MPGARDLQEAILPEPLPLLGQLSASFFLMNKASFLKLCPTNPLLADVDPGQHACQWTLIPVAIALDVTTGRHPGFHVPEKAKQLGSNAFLGGLHNTPLALLCSDPINPALQHPIFPKLGSGWWQREGLKELQRLHLGWGGLRPSGDGGDWREATTPPLPSVHRKDLFLEPSGCYTG